MLTSCFDRNNKYNTTIVPKLMLNYLKITVLLTKRMKKVLAWAYLASTFSSRSVLIWGNVTSTTSVRVLSLWTYLVHIQSDTSYSWHFLPHIMLLSVIFKPSFSLLLISFTLFTLVLIDFLKIDDYCADFQKVKSAKNPKTKKI